MPVVSKVVSIDVQSNLSKFTEEFEKYNEMLNKQPEVWAEVGKESKAMADGFKAMSALMLAQLATTHKIAEEVDKVDKGTKSAAFSWDAMGRSSKTVFNNVVGATRQLEKWTGIFSLTAGFGLGGSIWGLERLAASAGAGRREATGLGLTYGEQRAFGVTYGRFVDSDTLLKGVSTARGDVSSAEARAMFALGMVPGQSGDTAEAAQETLKRVRALAQRTPDNMLGTISKAYGLDALGYSTEDLRRLKGASDKEIDQEGYKRRAGQFAVTDKALRDMQEFDMALESAGIKIKSTFIELLAPLAPQLNRLAEGLSDTVKAVMSSQGFKDGIDFAAKELHEFGDYINTPAFKQDIKDLADGISYASKRMVEAARFIGLLPTKESEDQKKANKAINALPPSVGGGPMGWLMKKFFGVAGGGAAGTSSSGSGLKTLPDGTVISDDPAMSGVGMSAASDEKMLGLIAKLEGSPDINGGPQESPKHAIGKYQIMADTARGLGYDPQDRYDPVKNKEMAGKLIAELSARYHGNVAEILAAYNGGPTVGDYLRDHGDKQLPRGYEETQGYLRRAGFDVTINNNTGGSAVATVSNASGVSGFGTPGPSILQ